MVELYASIVARLRPFARTLATSSSPTSSTVTRSRCTVAWSIAPISRRSSASAWVRVRPSRVEGMRFGPTRRLT